MLICLQVTSRLVSIGCRLKELLDTVLVHFYAYYRKDVHEIVDKLSNAGLPCSTRRSCRSPVVSLGSPDGVTYGSNDLIRQ